MKNIRDLWGLILGYCRKHRILFPAALLLLAAACAFLRRGSGLSVEVAEVTRQDVRSTWKQEGRITFGQPVTVLSEVGGTVKELLVKENERVRAGQPLLTLDDAAYSYQKSVQEAQLERLKAQLQKISVSEVMADSPEEYLSALDREAASLEAAFRASQTDFSAAEQLYQNGDISRAEYESRKAAYEAAAAASKKAGTRAAESRKALERLEREEGISRKELNDAFYSADRKQLSSQMDAVRAEIEHLSEEVEKCRLVSSTDGTITDLPIQGQSFAAVGQPLLTISPDGEVQAEAEVLSSVAPLLKTGDPVSVRISLSNQDEVYEGRISEIYDTAEKSSSALGTEEYRVKIRVSLSEDQEGKLRKRNGYGATLELLLYEGQGVLSIPSTAVYSEEHRNYVYCIKNGKAVRTEVGLQYQGSGTAVIQSGLSEGDRVVREADAEGLFDGARIKIRIPEKK